MSGIDQIFATMLGLAMLIAALFSALNHEAPFWGFVLLVAGIFIIWWPFFVGSFNDE